MVGAHQVLFGGFTNQFGWAFLGFGLIFVWVFGLSADLSFLRFSLADTETTEGVILRTEATNASENEMPIYAYTYAYRVESLEAEYQGTAYSTGREFEPGWSVTVEYLKNNPDVSRIEGMRRSTFGPWVLCLVIPFPLVGLGFAAVGLSKGFKANRLLAHGKIGLGTLKSRLPTGSRVNTGPFTNLSLNLRRMMAALLKWLQKRTSPTCWRMKSKNGCFTIRLIPRTPLCWIICRAHRTSMKGDTFTQPI